MLSCISSLCILEINPLSDVSLANMFSHSAGSLFILLMVSFTVQKFFNLMQSHLFFFLLPKEINWQKCWYERCLRFYCLFYCRIFMVLQLNFFIHSEFILVHGISQWSSFFFVCTCPIFPMTIIEEIVFTVRCCILCQMLIDHEGMGLFLGSLFCSNNLNACS